jgi:hypothetical protein
MSDHHTYESPTVTRVALQPTQAVLSPCSTSASSAVSNGPDGCVAPFDTLPQGCTKNWGMTGADSAAQS